MFVPQLPFTLQRVVKFWKDDKSSSETYALELKTLKKLSILKSTKS